MRAIAGWRAAFAATPQARFAWLAIATVLALAAGACAPPPRPGSAIAEMAARYDAGCEARERMLRAMSMEVVIRVDGRAAGRLPALPATLAIATPDRVRLQVVALLGVGFDVLLDPDSLRAWAPGQRLAFAAPVESLGMGGASGAAAPAGGATLGGPATLAGRVAGADWPVPREAWRSASAESTGWRVAWREGGDSITVSVDHDSRPLEAWVGREGTGLRVRYTGWTRLSGGAFPERWELADDSGWARLRVRLDEATVEPKPGADWFTPRRSTSVPLGWSDLRELLHRRGLP